MSQPSFTSTSAKIKIQSMAHQIKERSNTIRKDRKNSTLKTNHGGVLMAIKENVHYEEIDAQIEKEEYVVAKLTGETGHHQILCCVYNPPKNSKYQWKQQMFISLFENLTKLQIQHNCNALPITGDIDFE